MPESCDDCILFNKYGNSENCNGYCNLLKSRMGCVDNKNRTDCPLCPLPTVEECCFDDDNYDSDFLAELAEKDHHIAVLELALDNLMNSLIESGDITQWKNDTIENAEAELKGGAE
jgi:hypothetical protein